MTALLIYGLVALVIFLLIELHHVKQNRYTNGYWDGYENGYRNMEIVCKMMHGLEEEDDETTETEQQ